MAFPLRVEGIVIPSAGGVLREADRANTRIKSTYGHGAFPIDSIGQLLSITEG